MVGDIFQPTHLLFVLVVALLVLGPKKLPEVGRQLGNGLRDFRAAINGERSEPEEVQAPYEQAAQATPAEHEFAHEPSAEDSSTGHEFAHEPPAEDTSTGHEFAHEPETVAADVEPVHGEKAAGAHEFAYETSESSDKPTPPPA
jgi:sec-independent protein translocase protein TatA